MQPEEPDKDKRLKGGLNYSEYKRQNNLRLLEQLSKRYELATPVDDGPLDDAFFGALDGLLLQFVGAVTDLKKAYDTHLTQDFVKTTLSMQERADTLIEEMEQYELLKTMDKKIQMDEKLIKKLEVLGVKLPSTDANLDFRGVYLAAIEEVKNAGRYCMNRAQDASLPVPEPKSALLMLKATIPCVVAVKKLVILAKEATVELRTQNSEEQKKRDLWKKECLQNEHVKELFTMWESQILGETHPSRQKAMQALTPAEIKMLEEPLEGIVFDDKIVKGGKVAQLVLLATHYSNPDDEFTAALLMTHHSFTTSMELLDHLVKRYEITPPYDLTQRMFEVFLDKKVVQVRLRVCNVFLKWIKCHFEEDFVDNEPLLMKFRDFIEKKVALDFENMAATMVEQLEIKVLNNNLVA